MNKAQILKKHDEYVRALEKQTELSGDLNVTAAGLVIADVISNLHVEIKKHSWRQLLDELQDV